MKIYRAKVGANNQIFKQITEIMTKIWREEIIIQSINIFPPNINCHGFRQADF
jgi:hypothetical protein